MTDPVDATAPSTHVAAPQDPRVIWAAERTFLAWIRTGAALMGFGFVVARFGLFLRELVLTGAGVREPRLNATYVGVGMVVLGVAVNLVATVRYLRLVRALSRNEPIAPDTRFAPAIALGAAAIGLVLVALLGTALVR
jgi:putative membrane protein